jgi:hypothetical protein
MLIKVANNSLIKGLETSTGREVISLQYADDTILFSSIETPHLRNCDAPGFYLTLMVGQI